MRKKPITSYNAIVDLQSSRSNFGIDECPCIGTQSFLRLQTATRLSMEMLCLQGFYKDDIVKMRMVLLAGQMGALVGNSFTCTVIQRLLKLSIRAAEAMA